MLGHVDRYFGIRASGSSMATELRAAVATFLTMAYILFVNPSILSNAIQIEGVVVFPQLLTATALASALGCVVMGVVARYPFALAPGMGLNAYFAFTVCGALGIPWQTALGAVLLSGLVFAALTLLRIREVVVNAIPGPLKLAIGAGIGLFLVAVGLRGATLLALDGGGRPVLGTPAVAPVLLGALGLIVTAGLLWRRVTGAILVGIVLTSTVAILVGAEVFGPGTLAFGGFTDGVVRAPVWPTDIAMQLDVLGALELGFFGIVFVFLFVDFFDTAGTLIGLSHRGGFLDESGELPRATHAFMADAVATTGGALLGTSTTTAYIESASGIEEGGRTGLVAVLVGLLFLGSIFFWPLATAVPAVATAPALICVGVLMCGTLRELDWRDWPVALPVALTVVGMPIRFSIADGIALGIVTWVLTHTLTRRFDRIHWLMWLLAALLVVRYWWMAA